MSDVPLEAYGLGRRFAPDPRDRNFRLSPPLAPVDRTFRSWLVKKPVLDQGPTSQCVAYSGVAYLKAHPVVNKPVDMVELYQACRKVDEWPGEDYDGTSVRALFKTFKTRGYVDSYHWAWDVFTVVQHVLTTGPVVMGTTWKEQMFYPGKNGYIRAVGPDIGGHAYLIVCVNTRRKNPDGTVGAARILNSWGEDWGQQGRAWISFADLDMLIKDSGEACASTEKKLG